MDMMNDNQAKNYGTLVATEINNASIVCVKILFPVN